jgi:hypothetical protein
MALSTLASLNGNYKNNKKELLSVIRDFLILIFQIQLKH